MAAIRNFNVSISKTGKDMCCANISGNGDYYNCVMGKHDHGYFIALMNWNICIELNDIGNTHYNREKIYSQLHKSGADTICTALGVIKGIYDDYCN